MVSCPDQITVTAAILMHEPKAKGRLYCQPLMSAPSEQPLAPPDRQFWHRVTIAMCLSRQQRQNCLRLRGAHMHKMQEIIQQRYQINQMLQVCTLSMPPQCANVDAASLDDSLQAACDMERQSNMRKISRMNKPSELHENKAVCFHELSFGSICRCLMCKASYISVTSAADQASAPRSRACRSWTTRRCRRGST